MFYSKSQGGFFHPDIHSVIPEDAIHESEWGITHAELMQGQTEGKIIVSDRKGCPTLKVVKPTKAELLEQTKAEASAYLASTDWYITRKMETGEDIPSDVSTARAKARATLNKEA